MKIQSGFGSANSYPQSVTNKQQNSSQRINSNPHAFKVQFGSKTDMLESVCEAAQETKTYIPNELLLKTAKRISKAVGQLRKAESQALNDAINGTEHHKASGNIGFDEQNLSVKLLGETKKYNLTFNATKNSYKIEAQAKSNPSLSTIYQVNSNLTPPHSINVSSAESRKQYSGKNAPILYITRSVPATSSPSDVEKLNKKLTKYLKTFLPSKP